jgi:uncharacterized protein (TIGR02118 family)
MLKFMVVIYRRPEMTHEEFRRHLQEVHAPLVRALPGLRKYAQNYVCPDPKRKPPGWDAIVEVYFDSWEAMEAAWATPQGEASDADLPAFADLTRTSWSVVEEVTVLERR